MPPDVRRPRTSARGPSCGDRVAQPATTSGSGEALARRDRRGASGSAIGSGAGSVASAAFRATEALRSTTPTASSSTKFADGWFVIRAKDTSLVGSRVVSIGGAPIDQVEAVLRPLVPFDNESGELDSIQALLSWVEYLHGAGIVDDLAKPSFVLEQPDGARVTVDPAVTDEPTWEQELGILGGLTGDGPEAVARRGEPIWTRRDEPSSTFLISINDYTEVGLPEAIAAMTAALDDGSADRVVLDMRYLRGGSGEGAFGLVDAFGADPRIDRPGGLTVLIGRENVSVATLLVAALEGQTQATLVGEQTPARADNFRCDCQDILLPNSGYTVTVPTYVSGTGDTRDSIEPDVPMALTAADFFAGDDPVLDAVLSGSMPSPAP